MRFGSMTISSIGYVPPNENKLSGRFTATRSDAVPFRWSAWLVLQR
jgi:hypothetical protein